MPLKTVSQLNSEGSHALSCWLKGDVHAWDQWSDQVGPLERPHLHVWQWAAAQEAPPDILEALWQQGWDTGSAHQGGTLLHTAVRQWQGEGYSVLSWVVAKLTPGDLNAPDWNGNRAIDLALELRRWDLAGWLRDQGCQLLPNGLTGTGLFPRPDSQDWSDSHGVVQWQRLEWELEHDPQGWRRRSAEGRPLLHEVLDHACGVYGLPHLMQAQRMLDRLSSGPPGLAQACLLDRGVAGQQALHHLIGLANLNPMVFLSNEPRGEGWLWAIRWALAHGADPQARSVRGLPVGVLLAAASGQADPERAAAMGQAMQALMDAGAPYEGPQFKGRSVAEALVCVRPEVLLPWLDRWTAAPEALAWREEQNGRAWPAVLVSRMDEALSPENTAPWAQAEQVLRHAWERPEFWTEGLGEGLLDQGQRLQHRPVHRWCLDAQAARMRMVLPDSGTETPGSRRPRL